MKKMKIGIVGFGEMGKRHALEFREATCGAIEVAAVVEPDDRRYEDGCAWNNMRFPRFAGVREMCASVQLDGVAVSVPNCYHLSVLQELAGSGLPVFLEKPLDSQLEKVADIVRFARGYEAPVMVDHVMRYAPIIRRAHEIIASGRLGRVCSFHFAHREECGPMRNFRRTLQGGGGQIIEKATHDLDVMLMFTSSTPERIAMISQQNNCGGDKPNDLHCRDCDEINRCINASTRMARVRLGIKDVYPSDDLCPNAREVDIADTEIALIQLCNGVFGTYSHVFFTEIPGHSRIYEINGTLGSLIVELAIPERYEGRLTVYPREGSGEKELYTYNYFNKIHYNGGPYAARHFLDVMSGNASPFTTVEQAFVAEMLGFAGMESARTGQFVKVADRVPADLRAVFAAPYQAREA